MLNSMLLEGVVKSYVTAPYKEPAPSAGLDLSFHNALGEDRAFRVASTSPLPVGIMVNLKPGDRIRVVGRLDRDDAGPFLYAEHVETQPAT